MKCIKRILIVLIVIIFKANIFASIVSDNDGSAFVSKAEFESLKELFNNQITSYNESIDTKIDGAIASYLAGIKVDQPPVELWSRLKKQMGDVWFSNNPSVGVDTIVTNNRIVLNRHYTLKKYNNIVQTIYLQIGDVIFPNMPPDLTIPKSDTNDGHFEMQGADDSDYSLRWWLNNEICASTVRHNGSEVLSGAYLRYDNDASTWLGTERGVNLGARVIPNIEAWNSVGWNRPDNNAWSNQNHIDQLTNAKFNHLTNKVVETAGSGSYYEYYTNPAGHKVLRNFYTNAYPVYDLSLTAHTYKSFICSNITEFRNYYCERTGKSDNTNLTYTVDEKNKFGTYSFGDRTKVADDSEESIAYYAGLSLYQVKTSDGKDYGLYLLGKNADRDVYCLDRLANITIESQTTVNKSETATTFQENQNLITGEEGCEQNLSGCELKYKSIKLTPETLKLKDFINEYVTTIAGETTYLGGGIPIVETLDDEQRLNIKIKFKSRTNTGAVGAGQVHYELSDKQFTNCAISTGATSYAVGTVDVGNEVNLTFDTGKKGNVWINFYSTTDGYDASVDSIQVTAS